MTSLARRSSRRTNQHSGLDLPRRSASSGHLHLPSVSAVTIRRILLFVFSSYQQRIKRGRTTAVPYDDLCLFAAPFA